MEDPQLNWKVVEMLLEKQVFHLLHIDCDTVAM